MILGLTSAIPEHQSVPNQALKLIRPFPIFSSIEKGHGRFSNYCLKKITAMGQTFHPPSLYHIVIKIIGPIKFYPKDISKMQN